MIRNIKGNNLLRKYQNGDDVTKPTVSPNAIAFTSGFETNRGYANNGYTSSTKPRNMSNDYGYILADVPEPLQVILLDAVHNQSNLPGTMILALAKNNPMLYQKLAIELFEEPSNAMQSAMIIRDIIGTTKAYEGKGTQLGLWIETIKYDILKAYTQNPKKFIDDFTKARIERNSSFGNKNTPVIQGSNSKMEEWAERSVAAAEYAKDLIDGDAETSDYYYDVNKNQNVFKQQIKPIVDFTLSNTFPGDGTEDSKEWYNEVNDLYNTETKTIQDTQKNTITQAEEPNLSGFDPNKQQATTNLPDDEVLDDEVSNKKVNPPENIILDTPATPPNDNYGVDKQTVYTDGDKHYIFEDNTVWEVDMDTQSLGYKTKIKGTSRTLSPSEKEETLDSFYELYGSGEEPTPLRTVGNVLEKGIEKIDKALRDKNPYRDDTYGPIKDKNKELREERKSARQKNQAVRRTGRAMKKKFNILEDTERIKQNRLKQNARAEKKAKKASDQLEFQEKVGGEKAAKAVANIKKKDKIQSKRREGKTERKFEVAELNKRIAQTEELLKPEEIENKQKKITIKKKNRLTQRENRKNRQITNRVKRLKEEREKLEQKEINATPLFGDMDRLEEALEEKKYGGRLKYRTGGNLIKYQGINSTINSAIIPGLPNNLVVGSKEWQDNVDRVANTPAAGRWPGTGDWNNDGIVTTKWGVPVKTKAEELEDAINYNKQYSAYDPYSLNRPSHKISNAANQAMTAYNLSLASQAPEKTPIFMTDYTPLRQYAPVDFKPATDQYNIGRRAIANNARGTGTLMGNLQQLNSNILNKKIDIAKRAADSQLGFDRTYETAKERIAKEFKDQKMNQYYKDLEHESTKQNAMTEAVSKWNQQQQTKAGYIQAKNKNKELIDTYVNQLSADYNVRLDKNGMAYVVHTKTGKKDGQKTRDLNMQLRRNLTEQRGQAMKLMKQAIDETDKIKYGEEIKSLDEKLKNIKAHDSNTTSKIDWHSAEIGKLGGNIKSKKTTNVLMDGGYTPRNKRQKKLRTKLY